jgi:hypothetical protein
MGAESAPSCTKVVRGRDNVMGMVLDDNVDWEEVGELLTESYCILAPKKLAALVHRGEEG